MPQLQIFFSETDQTTRDLVEDKVTVGRLADNMVHIDDGSVSGHHAELLAEGSTYQVRDLGSTNGTFVNGEQIVDAALRHGDEVRFGKVECVFLAEEQISDSQPLPETSGISSEVAQLSVRPEAFKNSSPFPKTVAGLDPVTVSAIALSVLAVVGFLAAMYCTMAMEAPV